MSGDAQATGTFTTEGDAWRFDGALTFDDAAAVFGASQGVALPAGGVVDFSRMTRADSAALAVVIALKRRATAEGRTLSVENLPQSLRSLAVVYGVDDLIG